MVKELFLEQRPQFASLLIVLLVLGFLVYKTHDILEPFAYGHARWADAYGFWFAEMHLDLGVKRTGGLNVEGSTPAGELFYYTSAPPLGGLVSAPLLTLAGGKPWAVRLLPLVSNLVSLWLIVSIARRWWGRHSSVVALALFCATPIVLKYGSSVEGIQAPAISLSLVGYLWYFRFLDRGAIKILIASGVAFAVGIGFNWIAAFLSVPVILHAARRGLRGERNLRNVSCLLAPIVIASVALLMQQGIATGDYLYPFRRALERAAEGNAQSIGWENLAAVQAERYWTLFGPINVLLSGYWLIRRAFYRALWTGVDGWVIALWLPGWVYAFVLRSAAFSHDFLMLGLVPGAILMSTAGARDLSADLRSFPLSKGRQWGTAGGIFISLLLASHLLWGARYALYFDALKQRDLQSGPARVPFLLAEMPANTIVAGTRWVTIQHVRSVDGKTYAVLWPFLDYISRHHVRYVGDRADVEALMCEASSTDARVVLLTIVAERRPGPEEVDHDWIESSQRFDLIDVITLRRPETGECTYDGTAAG